MCDMVTVGLTVSEKTPGQTDKKHTNKQTDQRRRKDYSRRATITNYSEDINYSYTFRGSGCGWYVGGMWAVQGLSTSGLSVGQRRVIGGSLVGHHQATYCLTRPRPTGVPPVSSSLHHTLRILVSYILNRARSPLFLSLLLVSNEHNDDNF